MSFMAIADDSDHGDSDHGGSDHGGSDHGGSDHGGSDHGDSDHGDSDHGDSDYGGSDHGEDSFTIWLVLFIVTPMLLVLFSFGPSYFQNKRINDYKEAVSSGKMDCEHPKVLQLAKKAIALDIKTAMTYGGEMRKSYLDDSDISQKLNSIAAIDLIASHISLGSIKTISTPQTPKAEKPVAFTNNLHGCSATAEIRIEPNISEQIKAEFRAFLHLQNNTIKVDVIYGTNSSSSGHLVVGLDYRYPITKSLFGLIFRANPD
jgi:hypothetical protein